MENKGEKINQAQFYNLITSEDVGWQSIIYDLVRTEQLDPWDIDLEVLLEKYIMVIEKMRELNFFISSKVLLACSLLLRLKSEILTDVYIRSWDNELYGREEKKREIERIEIDEDELPILVPRTPMPRRRKVTLEELMSALKKAMDTENRRIKRMIKTTQAHKSVLVVLPKITRIPLKQRIKDIYIKIKNHISRSKQAIMKYSELAPTRQEKISCFLPVLHLANQEKIWFEQPKHFDEIYLRLEMGKEEEILRQELGRVEDNVEETNIKQS